MAYNAVIDTANGYVKRYGYCDFSTDGSFNPGTETQEALIEATAPPDGVELYYVKIVAGAFVEMTTPEKDAIDIALLPEFKIEKSAEFDLHTTQILARGVEYPALSGDFYPITPEAVFAVEATRDAGTYPFYVNAVGYTNVLTMANATDANTFLAAAEAEMVSVLQGGAALLKQINDAPTKAALDAITDPRT